MITGSKNLPLDLTATWDGKAAVENLRIWASSDKSGDKETIDWAKYGEGFVYADSETKESFESYKLPFAVPDPTTNKLKAVLGGVNAVYGALKGARGGVDINETAQVEALTFINAYRVKFEDLKEKEEKATEGKAGSLPATDTTGEVKIKTEESEIEATEKRLRLAFPVNLEEKEHEVLIELIRIGHWKHPKAPGGVLVVTSELLNEFIQNFQNKVVGKELPLDLEHEIDGSHAIGWITDLTRNNGSMWARLDITDAKVQEDLRNRNLKYISPQIQMGWEDPETGKTYNVLRAAGLTNWPVIKNLHEAIVNFSEISQGRNDQLRKDNHALFLAEKRADSSSALARLFLIKLNEQIRLRAEETVQRELERLVLKGKLVPAEFDDTRKILLAGGETAKAHLRLIENRKPIIELEQKSVITAQKEKPLETVRRLQAILDKDDLPKDQSEKVLKELDRIVSSYNKRR